MIKRFVVIENDTEDQLIEIRCHRNKVVVVTERESITRNIYRKLLESFGSEKEYPIGFQDK